MTLFRQRTVGSERLWSQTEGRKDLSQLITWRHFLAHAIACGSPRRYSWSQWAEGTSRVQSSWGGWNLQDIVPEMRELRAGVPGSTLSLWLNKWAVCTRSTTVRPGKNTLPESYEQNGDSRAHRSWETLESCIQSGETSLNTLSL